VQELVMPEIWKECSLKTLGPATSGNE